MQTQIEFSRKAYADDFRGEFEEHLCSQDDKRLKTVTLADDAPEQVIEEGEDRSMLGADTSQDIPYPEIGDAGRDQISDHGGFDAEGQTYGSWRKAKGVLQANGFSEAWREAIPFIADYSDPTDGAEAYVDRQRSAAEQGRTGNIRGVQDEGTDQTMTKARQAAERADAEQCNHAEGACRSGAPEACEYLQEVCGYSEEEVEQLIAAGPLDSLEDAWDDDRLLIDKDDGEDTELPGKVLGALKDLWGGYKDHITQAKQTAAAINEIRSEHGQDPIEFRELGDRAITPDDPVEIEDEDNGDRFSDDESDDGEDDDTDDDDEDSAEWEDTGRGYVSEGGTVEIDVPHYGPGQRDVVIIDHETDTRTKVKEKVGRNEAQESVEEIVDNYSTFGVFEDPEAVTADVSDLDTGAEQFIEDGDVEALTEVEGIGPKRAKRLLDEFGDLRGVSQAAGSAWGQVADVEGISEDTARDLFDRMRDAGVYEGSGATTNDVEEYDSGFIDGGDPAIRAAAAYVTNGTGTEKQQRFMEVINEWAGTVAHSYDDLIDPAEDLAFVTVGNHNSAVNLRRIVETAIYEHTDDGLETLDTQQQDLEGDTSDRQQSRFAGSETGDTETRHEEEQASSLLENDRSDAGRGASDDSDSGEQRRFRDPDQEGLGE